MFIRLMVVRLRIQTKFCVGRLPVHKAPQAAICSSEYDNVQEGRWPCNTFSMVNWMLGFVLSRWLMEIVQFSGPQDQMLNVSLT
jgi:hypothetical protein